MIDPVVLEKLENTVASLKKIIRENDLSVAQNEHGDLMLFATEEYLKHGCNLEQVHGYVVKICDLVPGNETEEIYL